METQSLATGVPPDIHRWTAKGIGYMVDAKAKAAGKEMEIHLAADCRGPFVTMCIVQRPPSEKRLAIDHFFGSQQLASPVLVGRRAKNTPFRSQASCHKFHEHSCQ